MVLDGPLDKRLPMTRAKSRVVMKSPSPSPFMCDIITISGSSDALEPWEDKWGDGDGGVVVKCHQQQPDTDGSAASADQGLNI